MGGDKHESRQILGHFVSLERPGKKRASCSALESLQRGGVQTLSVLLQAGTVAVQGMGFPLCSGQLSPGPYFGMN